MDVQDNFDPAHIISSLEITNYENLDCNKEKITKEYLISELSKLSEPYRKFFKETIKYLMPIGKSSDDVAEIIGIISYHCENQELITEDLPFVSQCIPSLCKDMLITSVFPCIECLEYLAKIPKSYRNVFLSESPSIFLKGMTLNERIKSVDNYLPYESVVPDYCKLFTNPKESIATIYQAGLSPTSVMHRISAIKDIFMKDQTLGEKAWEVYLEHNLSTKLAKYYEISTNSWNKLLLGLTEKLQPMFSKAAWAVIISKMLENRLPMGIIAGENGNSYFTDYLQVSNQDSRLPKYIEEGPKVTLYNDVLADKNEAYTYANGVYGKNELERVGYYILMPKLEQPKGLVIRVYGGRQKSDAQTSKYTGTPDAFSKKLLGQGYAIAYLNLADLHFNNAFQAQMPENIFDSVLEGINLFINPSCV